MSDKFASCQKECLKQKVVIRNKTARRLAVRLPRWVDPAAVSSSVNGRRAAPWQLGRRVVFDTIRPKDIVEIAFPVVESVAAYTVGWTGIHVPGWTEVTRLLDMDRPPVPLEYQVSAAPRSAAAAADRPVFTIRFRGNDVVDIAPRESGSGYPLYRRQHLQAGGAAPMRKVTRVVPDRLIDL